MTKSENGDTDKWSYKRWTDIGAVIHLLAMIISLTVDAISTNPDITAIPSGIGLSSVVLQLIIAFKWFYADDYENTPELYRARKFTIIGFVIGAIGAVLWITVENGCKHNDIFKYFFAHSVWHIVMATGIYNTAMVVMYLDTLNKECHPYFKNTLWYHSLIPVLRVRQLRHQQN